ncbi:hypothetical protein [Trichococcus shcherbakoviae]|uniref:Uncharacterized protein n=1 Tax=Trichococcus shcherbakoviae subsp. psychrophilus TaxID=2585775 RepID=A0A5C5E7B1_9LACT|nr:hypothetical protein [Trichococcus shcherbakoviae]TNV68924.1 hypothetical protein FHK04_05215 [Trichococcus shcherbakoviae subsp. psychrophilus]
MNRIGRIIGIVIVAIIGLVIFSLETPWGVVLGAIGIWYFTKKAPFKGKKIVSIALLALSVICVAFGGSDAMATQTTVNEEKIVATAPAESVLSEKAGEEEQESKTSTKETEKKAEEDTKAEKKAKKKAEKKAKADAKAKKKAEKKAKKLAEKKAKADAKAKKKADAKAKKPTEEQALTDAKANGNSTETLQPIMGIDASIQSIELIEGTLKVVYKVEDTWSGNLMLTTFPTKAVSVLEALKDNPNITGYVFERLASMSDAKGHSSTYPVIVVYFSQENAKSINYEAYNIKSYDNFYTVADALRIDMNVYRDTDLQKDGIEPNRGVDNNVFIESANNYGQF